MSGAAQQPSSAVTPELQREALILCKACGHVLTASKHRVERGGAHEHTFRNPHGYSFHVRCFAAAPGAAKVGPATAQDSWFPGFQWSFAVCAACRAHLGWWFSRAGESFAGLIATRLSEPA